MQNLKTIADLNMDETAYIADHQEDAIPLKLLQMGCTSNTKIKLSLKAPSSDPICIHFSGNDVALRLSEAKKIRIKTV